MNTKKMGYLSAGLLVLVGIGCYFWLKQDKSPSLHLKTTPVTTGDIVTIVTATGTIEPLVTVEVGTQVSGEIAKVYVDYSSMVKKGQLLAELDKSTLQATLISSKASYESAKNELTYQESNYNRIKQLYESESASKTDFETAQYQYNAAKYAFIRAEQDLEKAQTNLSYANIYSPIDGVVLSRAVDEGQTVAASFNTPTMFTIAKDLKQMRVIADVDEADIGSVKVGQPVSFTVDAFPDDEFSGTVTMIRLEAQVTSNVVTYEVVIDAPNPDLKLLPGLTATVSITTNERRQVPVISNKALQVKPTEAILALLPASATSFNRSATTTVWVKNRDGSISQRSIVTGVSDGVNTEVLSGLQLGDEVITELSLLSNNHSSDTGQMANSPFMPSRPNQKSSKK
jgi:HlyD family secretion protein